MSVFKKIVSIFCSFSVVQASLAGSYTVQKGDTLSKIVAQNFRGRIYGRGGSLEKLLSQNPQIQNPNLIHTGSTLEIDSIPTLAQSAETQPDTEKIFVTNNEVPKEITTPENRFPAEASWLEQTRLSLSPIFGYRRFDSTQKISGASFTALSNLGHGFNLDWLQRWDDSNTITTSLGLKLMRYKFEVATNKALEGADQTYSKIYLSGSYHYGYEKQNAITATLGADREQTLRAVSETGVAIESVLLPSFELNHHLRVFRHKNLEAYWDAGLGTVLASNGDYATKTSLYLQTGVGIIYRKPWGSLESSINYRNLDLGVENGSQITRDLAIILGVGFDL